MNRRSFLTGILAAAVAPAIIRTPGLLMPIKPALAEPIEEWLPVEFTGFTPFYRKPGSLYAELTDVTRRAFVPRQIVDLYYSSPVLKHLTKAFSDDIFNCKNAAPLVSI